MVSSVLSIPPQTWLLSRLPISDSSHNCKSNLVYCRTTSVRGVSVKRQSTARRSRSFTETNRRTPSLQSKHEFWEDPDDGSDSENEEDEEDEDGIGNDLDYESDWEDDSRSQKLKATHNYEEELAREVEQLLEPEERAILQQNDKPNLKMISTKSWKPLQTLALSMQIPLMDNLIANGLDVDDVDKDNQTALHKAILGKKEAVISHLLRKGANPHLQDRDGAAPLHYAVQVGALQTVKLLIIKYNVDVNVADNEGWTPLHIAVQSRNRDITKILLSNGADKTRRTKDGKLALDLALCFGRDFKSYDLVKLLKIMPAGDI
ncbi:PREDICTED: ankyrin repeat domain-containing protein EMB506, chloroplastic [Camelina sativa]|uniref:Ankyrin repeat domain-containing protein EMB506, chloroplastic n=1 Tax=Camelina sativa TaxID=90675 RepID=A0ABM0UHA3_CAMSA|nr:PREDICTED: ankyrin repeat domain-containing protein EMB506, chloroplastic [Camelina sativa]